MKFLLPFLGIWSFGLIASMDLAQHGFEAIILAKQSSIPEMVHFPASKNIRRDLSYGILKTLPEMLNAGLDLIMMFNDHKLNGYEGASTEGDILHEVLREIVSIDELSVPSLKIEISSIF